MTTQDPMAGPNDAGEHYEAGHGMVRSSTPPTVSYINESGVEDKMVFDELRKNEEIASLVEQWSKSLSTRERAAAGDLFGRSKWNGAGHVFAVMGKCAYAVENDDILGTLADVLEGLSFSRCRFEMNDNDQEDVWNQWAAEVDLDSRLREMSRELYKVSQVYVGLKWGRRDYTVRTDIIPEVDKLLKKDDSPKGGNRKRRKSFSVRVPTAMTMFDPTKILPVGQMLFNQERFAYIATRSEDDAFSSVMKGEDIDPLVLELVEKRYKPSYEEVRLCEELGVDPDRLWLMSKGTVFRHTLTRAQYERFAPVRLKTVLPILDMKADLRASDKSSLVGNANFIVVITKGSDKLPAKPGEIENLKEQSRVVARMPVLVGDHRLKVEIISPALDQTLIESRWQVLDSRLVFKALQSFQPIVQGGNASGGVSEMSRVVSQGLENRRHQIKRSLERHIFKVVMDRNGGALSESPTMAFVPKHVSLDFQADVMNAILKLRDRGDISRETTLEELDFDQDVEVARRAKERATYDEVFQSQTPFGSPQTNPYGTEDDPDPKKDPEEDPEAVPPKNGLKLPKEPGRPRGVVEEEPRAPKRG